MPASLYGLAKYWFVNENLKAAVDQEGIRGLVVTASKGGLAKKDPWHAINNCELVEPVIMLMKDQHKIQSPYLNEIEHQVATFLCLMAKKPINDETLGAMKNIHEVDIHLTSSSLKKILVFLRKRVVQTNVPRDTGFENMVSNILTFQHFKVYSHTPTISSNILHMIYSPGRTLVCKQSLTCTAIWIFVCTSAAAKVCRATPPLKHVRVHKTLMLNSFASSHAHGP